MKPIDVLFKTAKWIALMAAASMPAWAATANDAFSGSGALTTGWTNYRSGLDQSGGLLVSTTSIGLAKNSVAPGADQYSKGTWGIDAANIYNGRQYLLVRFQDDGNYYMADLDDGRHDVTLIRRIGGYDATLYTVAVPAAFEAGDVITFGISGSHTLTLYLNGTSFGTYNDAAGVSTLTTGGVGIGMSGSSTDQGAWDYWEGGDSPCSAPVITSEPANATVTDPTTANFTVIATGTGLSYQWQKNGVNVSTGSGGTTASYTTAATSVSGENGAAYRVIVSGTCGVDTSSAAILTVNSSTAALPFSQNFEAQDSSCWASRPNGDENVAGCGPFASIGLNVAADSVLRLGRFGVSHSGEKSVRIRYAADEDASRFRVTGLDNSHLFVRQWMYLKSPYDHALGEKILRLDALDTALGGAYYEPICFIRSTGATSGTDAMGTLTCEPNGGSGDFGTATLAFPSDTWFELAFEFEINTPGNSDGICRIWYNDSLILSSTGLSNMRTSSHGGGYNHLTDNHNISLVSFGGWYSGGVGGAPNVPAVKYLDDVCVQTTKCPTLVAP